MMTRYHVSAYFEAPTLAAALMRHCTPEARAAYARAVIRDGKLLADAILRNRRLTSPSEEPSSSRR